MTNFREGDIVTVPDFDGNRKYGVVYSIWPDTGSVCVKVNGCVWDNLPIKDLRQPPAIPKD